MTAPGTSGSTEAIILIKASPQVGQRHGETVCCAGLDLYGKWLRLYPVSFRQLEDRQKFKRWSKIRFGWRRPTDDSRPESRRVDQQSLEITGTLPKSERQRFLAKAIVTSLTREREAGRSLALLQAEIREFVVERKTDEELRQDCRKFEQLQAQQDLFAREVAAYRPCPYRFKYRYVTDDGERFGTCQDWEIEATFFNRSHDMGEAKALDLIRETFGVRFPKDGMLLAMGTHSQYPDTWLINGVVRLPPVEQPALF
jgi:hypothetical protein